MLGRGRRWPVFLNSFLGLKLSWPTLIFIPLLAASIWAGLLVYGLRNKAVAFKNMMRARKLAVFTSDTGAQFELTPDYKAVFSRTGPVPKLSSAKKPSPSKDQIRQFVDAEVTLTWSDQDLVAACLPAQNNPRSRPTYLELGFKPLVTVEPGYSIRYATRGWAILTATAIVVGVLSIFACLQAHNIEGVGPEIFIALGLL